MVDELDFTRSHWAGISSEAKDFVRSLLHRDPAQRPTALQALQHPWLQVWGRAEGKGRLGRRAGSYSCCWTLSVASCNPVLPGPRSD
jgi:serine/threonine protein kinase